MNNVLFVVAHPDDAELAAGGTIKMLAESGSKVTVLNLTISEKTREARQWRVQAAERAANILGYELQWYEQGRFDHVADIKSHELVAHLDQLVRSLRADAVFSHWQGDSHNDHVVAAKAVLASSRSWSSSLYVFPPNELKTTAFASFTANTYVDITPYMEDKLEAIRQYNYNGKHYKSLEEYDFCQLNRFNGLMGRCEYAESYLLVRQQGLWMESPIGQRTESPIPSAQVNRIS
ncbi:MAG: PIG-L deacetylase family protein [Bacteroidota bacterium]